ncbi:MAG TPA: DUF1778 domain-containing protein [Bradyrhizobium sp.]
MNAAPSRRSRTAKEPARREAIVNLRMPISIREMIDNAAEILGKTRTAFIIESSRKHAIDVLLDQRLFTLAEDQYDSFVKALDEPPAPNEKLKRLMSSKAPWEK